MRVELVEFTRCCCCFPLRYGLMALGILKLISSITSSIRLINITVDVIKYLNSLKSFSLLVTYGVLGTIISITQSVLAVVFLVGCYKKCIKLLKVYFYYAVGNLVVFILVFLLLDGFIYFNGVYTRIYDYKIIIATQFINIFCEAYMILMSKSEISKLEKMRRFRFSNIAYEGERAIVEGGDGNNGTYALQKSVDQCEVLNKNEGITLAEKNQGGQYDKL